MVNARNSDGNANGAFFSLEGWRILAGDNIPGNRPFALRPERSPESIARHPIRLIRPIRPIPFCRPISAENSLSLTRHKPIIRPENKGIKPITNRHKYKFFFTRSFIKNEKNSSTPGSSILNPIKPCYTPLNPTKHPHPHGRWF